MVKLRDAIELTKNKAVKDNRYTDLFGKSELEKPSYQKTWRVENCSEVWSVRQAIMNGAEWENISFRCINIDNGIYRYPCENCKVTFKDLIDKGEEEYVN